MRLHRKLATVVFLLLSSMIFGSWAAQAATAPDLAAIRKEIDEIKIEPARAVSVQALKLNLGLAELTLDGSLVPASPVGGKTVELVFLGKGRIRLTPPDEVEAGQLDLYTGKTQLDEEFEEGVLVIGMDAAVASLLRRPAAALDEAAVKKATDLYGRFGKSTERKLLGVEGAILYDALEDPALRGYFAGWFKGKEVGDFYYLVSPEIREQIVLGQFVPIDVTEKEKKQRERQIHRQQRRGRLVGLEIADLGSFDTWVSSPMRDKEGKPRFGSPAFEPTKYTLDLTANPKDLTLSGKARIELKPRVPGSRVVSLGLDLDLVVKKVTDGTGQALSFQRTLYDLDIVLAEPPAAGEMATVVVEYAGKGLNKYSGNYALVSTTLWYPRDTDFDRATYDATYRWPKGIELVANGKKIDGGEAGGLRFERRIFEKPTAAVSFELGDFLFEKAQAGHVAITMAFDRESAGRFAKARREMLDTVRDSVLFFEDKFGPYPLDELTVVTALRGFSQGLQGFVTLSDFAMMDASDYGQAELNEVFGQTDRRLVIAHEVAHQWWGNLVGWASDRDQWISEAMANYSALLYGKEKITRRHESEDRIVGLTAGWHVALALETKAGRPVETVGPVVLGTRLASSRAGFAWNVIAYMKGSLVLEMLARDVGEENFNKAMRQIVKAVGGGDISTEDFLDILERVTGEDLQEFSDQFIYGTGMPEVVYKYRFEQRGPGKWAVVGSARQQTPYRFRFKAVKTGSGYDVTRQQIDQVAVHASSLVVPLEIEVAPPDGKKINDKNPVVSGQIRLTGETTEFDIPLDHEPRGLWLDPHAQIFGRFYNEQRYPKRVLYFQGLSAASAGRAAEAEVLFDKAYSAETEVAAPGDGVTTRLHRMVAIKSLNVYIDLSRARLFLDQGRDDDAEAALSRARRAAGGYFDSWTQEEIKVLESRFDARKGAYDKIVKRLRYSLLESKEIDSTEGYVLLAIAARETGSKDDYEKALRKARSNGSDLSALPEG